MKLFALGIGKLHAHFTEFLDTDTVLAGNRAPVMNTQLQNLAAQLFCFFEFALVIGVVQDQRMQVTVAGVKHVGHRQFVFSRQLADTGQHSGQ